METSCSSTHFERCANEKVAGTIRVITIDHVADAVVRPRRRGLLHRFPDLKIEIATEYRTVDIVAERYDSGIRWGEQGEKDLIAVRKSADQPTAIVGSPACFAANGVPKTPQDLLHHNCITLRLATSGGI
jgi:DNA-binding transcriptional LysR family regulator